MNSEAGVDKIHYSYRQEEGTQPYSVFIDPSAEAAVAVADP